MYRVGLDLRPTEPGFKSHFGRGIGRYTTELTSRLLECRPEDTGIQFVPLTSQTLWGASWEGRYRGFSPVGKITLETQFLLPRRLKKLGLDCVHYFAHGDAPIRGSVSQTTSVLDLIPLRFPELYKANKPTWRYHLARYLELESIRRADGIIAISECTKRDIVELLRVRPEKIAVTPLAVGEMFRPREPQNWKAAQLRLRRESPLQGRVSVTRPILLYVGGIDPRKNLPFLLEVLAELKSSAETGREPVLVLAGKIDGDDQYPRFIEKISSLGLAGDVIQLGFVTDAELVRLYQSAAVFVFPSLYEGFGFPVLEALSCGCPVVAGRNSSIPEVAGRAALLVSDNDAHGWSRAIGDFLKSDALQQEYAERGIKQASQFTWERTAELTLAAYQKFARLPGNRMPAQAAAGPGGRASMELRNVSNQ